MCIFSFLGALVAAYVLNVLISALGLNTWWWGAAAGAVVCVGMGATGTLTYSIFNGPPLGSWLLFSLYGLIAYAAGAVNGLDIITISILIFTYEH